MKFIINELRGAPGPSTCEQAGRSAAPSGGACGAPPSMPTATAGTYVSVDKRAVLRGASTGDANVRAPV